MKTNRTWKVILASIVFGAGIAFYFFVMIPGDSNRDLLINSNEIMMAKQKPLSHDIESAMETDAEGLSKLIVSLQTTRGIIKFKFYSKDAPQTARRIAELIQNGFYNDLTFHRVVPGFVIQGGDPTGTGEGGSGLKLKAEFNERHHVPGTVAMARSRDDQDSADSQFYITLGTHPHLDLLYTVFGQVIEGQGVANQIKAGDKMVRVSLEI